ncbi:MAG: response regulator transcription factor [Coprobacillaceae bacterium]
MTKILIVEDEYEIAMLEKDYLEMYGFETVILSEGEGVVKEIVEGDYSLVILDLMLPGKNGYDICREVRTKTEIPILMVTARGESVDKIRGLGMGADDYIAKPFDPGELVARVKAHLARYERLTAKNQGEEVITIGDIRVLTKSWRVFKKGLEIKLPNKEFELLCFLASNANIVFTKEQLYERIWGYDYVCDSATVMVHVNRIREKIEDDPQSPQIIETIWGAGYRLNLL